MHPVCGRAASKHSGVLAGAPPAEPIAAWSAAFAGLDIASALYLPPVQQVPLGVAPVLHSRWGGGGRKPRLAPGPSIRAAGETPEQRAPRSRHHRRAPARVPALRAGAAQEPRLPAGLPGLGPALRPDRPQPHPPPRAPLRAREEPRPRAHGVAAGRARGAPAHAAAPGVPPNGRRPLALADPRRQRSHPPDGGPVVQRGRGTHPVLVPGAGHGAS